tara:strand:+ start:742 stop:2436 length:1695 start_codon:yes stop_codon:yes gene_type:complete
VITQLKNFISILNTQQKKKFYLYFISIIIIGIIEVSGLITIIPLVNVFLDKEIPEYLTSINFFFFDINKISVVKFIIYYILMIVFFYFFKFLIISISYYFQIKFSFNIQRDISVNILDDFLNKDFLYYSNKNTPQIIRDSIGEVAILSGAIQSYLLLFFEIIILLISFFIILFFFDFRILLFSIVIFLIFYSLFLYISKLLKKWGKLRQDSEKKRIQILKDSLGSLKEIKFLSLEHKLKENFSMATSISYDANAKNIFLKFIPRYAVDFFAVLVFFIITFLVLNENNIDSFSIYIGILLVLMSRVIPSISRIASYVQNIKFNEIVFETIYERFKNSKNIQPIKTKPDKFLSIQFKNISFKYKDNLKSVFTDFNFSISRGEKILILGESGSGKSTFVDILIGLQKINTGKIFFNDKEIKNYHNLRLNEIISYLPQESYLFNSTLSSNITLSDKNEIIDEEKLNKCLSLSCINNFIDNLSDGKKTLIGEDGSKLSGGQKKRIGIARALYNLKNIIVLDEPTSFLDEKTELEIVKNIIKNKDLTVVMVSHKERFQEFFDKTINFNNN